MMAILSERFDTLEQALWIRTNFPEDDPKRDFSQSLQIFFSQLKQQRFPLRMMQLIKCIQQEMPYPAFTLMRDIIKLPFKDVPGTWKIFIVFGDKQISVIHQKQQQAQEFNAERKFWFEWKMALQFSDDLSTFSPSLLITDFDFDPEVTDTFKSEVVSAFRPLLSSTVQYYRIWKRPPSELNLASELSQMIRQTVISDVDGNLVS